MCLKEGSFERGRGGYDRRRLLRRRHVFARVIKVCRTTLNYSVSLRYSLSMSMCFSYNDYHYPSPPPIYRGLKEYTKSDAFFFFQSAAALVALFFFSFFLGFFSLFPFSSFLSFFLFGRWMDASSKSKNLKGKRSRRGKNRGPPERERVFKEKERDR